MNNLYLVAVHYSLRGCRDAQIDARNQIAPDEDSAVEKVVTEIKKKRGSRNVRIESCLAAEVSFQSLQSAYFQLAQERGIRV